ncbi:MAG: recombinase RecB [Actinomycetota bacterium]
MNQDGQPILLGGYAAKQCPVRTQNDFAPLVPRPQWEWPAEVLADLEAGQRFEAEVFAELLSIHSGSAVAVDAELRKAEAIEATSAAMQSGAMLILGGWLPDDEDGGRTGKPDVLVKVDGGYLPADVKHHKTLEAAKKTSKVVSSFAHPGTWRDEAGLTASTHHFEDSLQLAHYTRMLQACGLHPGERRMYGAIIGTSLLAVGDSDPELVFVWHDLTRPTRPTFSRSRGRVLRSVLERYDHEHAFRVKVAATARGITGSGQDPEPLVVPIGQKECALCPYGSWCAEQLGPDDASGVITRDRLDTREWQTLRRMGFTTTGALANLDVDDPAFFEEYYPEVTHRSRTQAAKRLAAAVRQARMITEGVDFQPIPGTVVEVPSADIEIDFDIEWDTAGRIYQWGLRVRDGYEDATARYEPVVSFEPLDEAGELELATRFAARIQQLRAEAERCGRTIAVYHWHHVEVSMTRKFDCVAAALDGLSIDLHTWFTSTFHVRGEASIKAVAQFFGFTWQVDDPGGRLSQEKIEIARGGGPEAADARQWCLSYNGSDVAAQAAIRDGVRVMFVGTSD